MDGLNVLIATDEDTWLEPACYSVTKPCKDASAGTAGNLDTVLQNAVQRSRLTATFARSQVISPRTAAKDSTIDRY